MWYKKVYNLYIKGLIINHNRGRNIIGRGVCFEPGTKMKLDDAACFSTSGSHKRKCEFDAEDRRGVRTDLLAQVAVHVAEEGRGFLSYFPVQLAAGRVSHNEWHLGGTAWPPHKELSSPPVLPQPHNGAKQLFLRLETLWSNKCGNECYIFSGMCLCL